MRTRAPILAKTLMLVVCVFMAAASAGAAGRDVQANLEKGKTLFHAKCGYCHLAGGTGTMMLGFRLGKDKSLLENRTDLTTNYIEHVARSGIGSMPRLTRIEVPDSDLKLIAAYLTRPALVRDAAK